MKKKVCVLGSTGSVGESTLDVIRRHSDKFEVVGLACGRSIEKLKAQVEEFKPSYVSLGSEASAQAFKMSASGLIKEVFVGMAGHENLVEASQPDIVMASMSGTHGLKATLRAIERKVGVLGIANKEVLVMAGKFINRALGDSPTQLIPVDSEHSAIFQCLQGNKRENLRKIILTASGGPFRLWPLEKFSEIRPQDALKHPNWVMGAKITVDSASMMNKGLEYIEAIQLFQLRPEQIEIVVHPQSLIHSMVEYCDASIMAQLGISDMKIPIAYALSHPERLSLEFNESLDFAKLGSLTFESPDLTRFPCLRLAIESVQYGSAGTIALNAANELAVEAFLEERISFLGIAALVEKGIEKFSSKEPENLEEAVLLDSEVKSWTESQMKGENKSNLRRVSL